MNVTRHSVFVLAALLCARGAFAQTTEVPESTSNGDTNESAVALPNDGSVPATPPDTAPTVVLEQSNRENGAPIEYQAPADSTSSAEAARDAGMAALGIGEAGARRFVLFRDEASGAYVKPIIWASSAIMGYFPKQKTDPTLANQAATVVVTRFGFEGAVNHFVSFKLLFEKDLGFTSATGPVGTGVWEGTASIQARENYVSLHRWGLSLNGGIIVDPSTVDYISPYVLNLFGMDPYTRDPLLYSGFQLAQGVMLRYEIPCMKRNTTGTLTAGFSFTGGNPLTTSLSFGFGGQVTSLGTLYTSPLRGESNGIPGSNIHLMTYTPSLTYEVDIAQHIGVDIRAAAQLYSVDIDDTLKTDHHLSGANYRIAARIRLPYVNLMGNWARRYNGQIVIPNLSQPLGDAYESTVWSTGAEWTYSGFGVGGNYSQVVQEPTNNTSLTTRYVNVAASYAIVPEYVGVTLRYAQLLNINHNAGAVPIDSRTIMASLQLTI